MAITSLSQRELARSLETLAEVLDIPGGLYQKVVPTYRAHFAAPYGPPYRPRLEHVSHE